MKQAGRGGKPGKGRLPKKQWNKNKEKGNGKDGVVNSAQVKTANNFKKNVLSGGGRTVLETREPGAVRNIVAGLKKGDFRESSPVNDALQNDMTVSTATIGSAVVCKLSDDALIGFAISLVSRALVRGMPITYATGSVQKIVDILKAAALANKPVVDEIPGYIGAIAEALRPHSVITGTGMYNYAWDSPSVQTAVSSSFGYGNTSTLGRVWYGLIDPSTLDPILGLPTMIDGVHSEDNATIAFAKFVQYMNKGQRDTAAPLSHKEIALLRKDSSAFAGLTITDGYAYGQQGGTMTRQGSEAPIHYPTMSVFNVVKNSFADYNRAANYNIAYGGGPSEAGLLTVQHRLGELRNVIKPIFKTVDIEMLNYVFFKAMTSAIQQYIDSAEGQLLFSYEKSDTNAVLASLQNLLPQITLLEAKLALRNEYMKLFGAVQAHVFTMGGTNSTTENFLGLASGVGTCANFDVTPVDMPSYFAENLRALLPAVVNSGSKDLRYCLPILGIYNGFETLDTDFTVSIAGNGGFQSYPVFKTADVSKIDAVVVKAPVFGSPLVTKAKTNTPVPVPKAPSQFRIADGSYGSGYAQINEQAFLSKISAAINRCTSRVGKYLGNLGPNSSQSAANILKLGGVNTFCRRVPEADTLSYLDNTFVACRSFGFSPNKVVEQQFPRVTACHITNNSDNARQKADNDGETTRIQFEEQGELVTLRMWLDTVAEMCVSDGQKTNQQRELDRLSAAGMGGIFSSIASALQPCIAMGANMAGGALDSWLQI